MEWLVEDKRLIYRRGLAIRAVAAAAFLVFFGALKIAGFDAQIPGLGELIIVLSLLVIENPCLWIIGVWRQFNLADFRFHWALDVLAVSAIVYCFGLLDVPLTIAAYMIMIVSSATFGSPKTARMLAHWSAVCLISIVMLEEYGWIPHQHVEFAPHLSWEGKIITVCGGVCLFYVFGYLAGELASQLREKADRIDGQKLQMERAFRGLKEANERMVLLSSLVQHDVYGPLGVVSGACRRAIDQCVAGELVKAARSMGLVEDHLQSIEGAVSTLGMLCGEGQSAPGLVDVGDVIDRVVRDLETQCRNRRVTLRSEGPSLFVRLREEEVYHVLRNLVGNALRAVADDGSGEIVVRRRSDREECQIRVIDNGCGFGDVKVVDSTPADAVRVFSKQSGGGFGVGLRLVSSVVRGWGGLVEIGQNDRETGAEVVVRFPHSRMELSDENG